MTRLLLHAPNVHTGGGRVLLQHLLSTPNLPLVFANVDARAIGHLMLPRTATINAVRPSVWSRLMAERQLAVHSQNGDTVLCFHGIPPLLAQRGRVVVFLQNRLYLGQDHLRAFSARTRIRLEFERLLFRAFRRHVHEYVVQTESMAHATLAWHGAGASVRIAPFMNSPGNGYPRRANAIRDFIYVADGEGHKNHRTLLAAWVRLAEQGLRPSLALTLDSQFCSLLREIESAKSRYGLVIENLGNMEHADLLRAYSQSGALIFPSRSESFGLPLVEASEIGLPILASERDFVRDICDPVATFDPDSPTSIARAVRRHLGEAEVRPAIRSSANFIEELMR